MPTVKYGNESERGDSGCGFVNSAFWNWVVSLVVIYCLWYLDSWNNNMDACNRMGRKM